MTAGSDGAPSALPIPTPSTQTKIAADEGLKLVLEKNEAGILWAAASLDLTNEIIRRYDGAPKSK